MDLSYDKFYSYPHWMRNFPNVNGPHGKITLDRMDNGLAAVWFAQQIANL